MEFTFHHLEQTRVSGKSLANSVLNTFSPLKSLRSSRLNKSLKQYSYSSHVVSALYPTLLIYHKGLELLSPR